MTIRECAYDCQSKVGKRDKALEEAMSKDWIVVDIEGDWETASRSRTDRPMKRSNLQVQVLSSAEQQITARRWLAHPL